MPNKKANPDYLAQVTKDFVVYLRAYADFLRDNNEEKKKDAFVQIQGRAQILIEQTDAGLDFLFKENASATQAAGNQKAKKVSPLQFAVTNGLTEVVQFFFSEACNAHPPALLMTNKHGPLPGQQSILMQLVDQIASLLAMPSDLKRDRQLDAVLEMLRVIKDSGALRREGTSTPQSPQKQKTKKAIDTPSELDPTIRTVYNTHIDALTKAQLPGIITRQDTAGLRALKHFVELLPGRVFSRCTDIANKDIRIDGKLVFTWIDYWAQQVNLTRDGGIACSVPDFFVLLLSSGALFGHVVQMDLIKRIASENHLLSALAIALL